MKRMFKLLGIIALLAVIGFSMIACSDPDAGTPPPPRASYVSFDEITGNRYELVITEAATDRAVYTPKTGDTYVLTITGPNGTVLAISTGTVASVSGGSIGLQHNRGTVITVTVSGNGDDGAITNFINDNIPIDGNVSDVSKPKKLIGLEFELIGNDECKVIKSRITSGPVEIPKKVGNNFVTEIGYGAFKNTNITGVTILADLRVIDGEAFAQWTSSQTINIQGHANRQSTINAGWDNDWDTGCNATIIYSN